MNTPTMKAKEIKREWHLIDLDNKVLGRAATEIAVKLMGKNKAAASPNLDCGDYVVVINAAKVIVTRNKALNKLYQSHSMHPGGFKEINFADLMKKDPKKVITHAVQGMLPKNKLRDGRMKRLKIFVDANHSYAQQFEKKES
jgi:large subunit ribosomal protein L13